MALASGVVDVAVHPRFARDNDLRAYMVEPWRSFPFPPSARYICPAPTGGPWDGEFLPGARPDGGAAPASDPGFLARHLAAQGVSRAILTPLTRGLLPNIDLADRICSATNQWLAEKWLEGDHDGITFYGSIRVNPDHPDGAVREIERWAAHRRMVQVAVALESHQPYGKRQFAPIWAAAQRRGLVVAVRSDGGCGTDFFSTPNGYPSTHVEYSTLLAPNFIYHLTSLIAEGMLDRLPELKFVFLDGGHDMLMPLMWRMDTEWPNSRIETPWITREPSTYLLDHLRFSTSRLEGPDDDRTQGQWLAASQAGELLLFGSGYPHWHAMAADEAVARLRPAEARRVRSENAHAFYPRLMAQVTA